MQWVGQMNSSCFATRRFIPRVIVTQPIELRTYLSLNTKYEQRDFDVAIISKGLILALQ